MLSGQPFIIRNDQHGNRICVKKVSNNLSVNSTIHTVTVGKKFYLTNFILSAFNTSTSAAGHLTISDGASTVIIPFSIPKAITGQPIPSIAVNSPEQNESPFNFDASVRAIIVAGSITYSIAINGYEELI